MNKHISFKQKIFWSVFISVIISLFAIGYVPFCKLETEQGPDYYPTFDLYIQRAMAYKKKMYLYKGRSFNATCRDGEKLTVHLGWDNCIYAKKGTLKRKFTFREYSGQDGQIKETRSNVRKFQVGAI